MILVTGGTGLVGAHLLYKLIKDNQPVRAIFRTEKKQLQVKQIFSYYTKNYQDLFNKIEWIKADLNDIHLLSEVFNGITQVYHCAAFVSFEPNKFELLKRTNIEGTANIVNFCISNNIKKLCYVSSIATIGVSKTTTISNETTEWNVEADNSEYAITKYGGELEVWRGTQEGVDSIIVNPGVIIGAGIWKYGSGSIIKKNHKGLKYYTSGSVGYIGVEDVVDSMIKLMNSEIKNERFILVSENWSYKKFLTTSAEALQVNPPKKEAKKWVLVLGFKLDWLKHKLTGKRRVFTKALSQALINNSEYDNSKFKIATSFEFTPISKVINHVCKQYLEDLKK